MEARALSGWNQAPWPRDQILRFRETLGDRIPDNHSVRLFAEILDQLDLSACVHAQARISQMECP